MRSYESQFQGCDFACKDDVKRVARQITTQSCIPMLFRPCSVRGSLQLFVGCCVFLVLCAADVQAADISLLPPSVSSGLPNVVSRRADAASFSNVGFTEQMIADMLWASCGVNRPLDNGGRRTTNYSWNLRDTDVYLAASNGLFLYDAVDHKLVKKHGNDIRSLINPESINPAYVVIHVSNSSRLGSAGEPSIGQWRAPDHELFLEQT